MDLNMKENQATQKKIFGKSINTSIKYKDKQFLSVSKEILLSLQFQIFFDDI